MSIVTYKCSKTLWFLGIVIPFFISFICFAHLDHYNWPHVLPVIAILTAVAIHYCKQCFTYDLKDKAALLLDNEKLIYYIDYTVIYWKDITDISYGKTRGQGLSIFFTVKGQGIRHSAVCVPTDMVEGDDWDIYNDILERYIWVKTRETLLAI